MTASVKKFDPRAEYYFEEGCFINELSNSGDDSEVSIARARVEPGQTTKWHSLREISERYVIQDGQGIVEVGDSEPTLVVPGDVVIIDPGQRQRISNQGDTDLVFLAVCSPPFDASSYQELE